MSEKEEKQETVGEEEMLDTNPEETQPDCGNDEERETLKARIEELEQENSNLKDQYLRKQADFENFRKRMQREKEDALKYANSSLLQDLINIIDDFERAINSSQDTGDFQAFYEGIKIIEKQFVSMLNKKYGLTRFDAKGEAFDPEKHEAMMMEEADTEDQMVLEVFQNGYTLHERVLRHAKVKVSKPKDAAELESEATDQE